MKSFRERPEYQEWKRRVKERYSNTCLLCKHEGNIHAHHIKPVSAHPELAFDVDNGVTLCGNCHVEYKNCEVEVRTLLTEFDIFIVVATLVAFACHQRLKSLLQYRQLSCGKV